MAGAALLTFFFPLIALIAALLLVGRQADPRMRSRLRTWAWLSGGWLVLSVVLVLLAVGAVGGSGSGAGGVSRSRSGPCQGGPKLGAAGTQIPGTHKFVFACVFGGTETTRMP